jgi:hypothetical protein
VAVSGQLHTPAALPKGETTPVPTGEDGWDPELVCMLWRRKSPLPLPGTEPQLLGHPAHSLVIIETEVSWLIKRFAFKTSQNFPCTEVTSELISVINIFRSYYIIIKKQKVPQYFCVMVTKYVKVVKTSLPLYLSFINQFNKH